MEKRLFGKTNHSSTVAIFGGAALWQASQKEADEVIEKVLSAGINHIDVAPSYGLAEERIGPRMPPIRERFFLGCKTMERTKAGAIAELHRSLTKLQVEQFDLYQIHAITTLEQLDEVTRSGGALEAMIEARRSGLTRHIGITGHGYQAPTIFLEALRRFEFDSVLFPLNFILFADPTYRENTLALIKTCQARNVGMMVIKSITKGPWGDKPKTHTTWYEPFTDYAHIRNAVHFVLSQPITGICTSGDMQILPLVIRACEEFKPLSAKEQKDLIDSAHLYESLFKPEEIG